MNTRRYIVQRMNLALGEKSSREYPLGVTNEYRFGADHQFYHESHDCAQAELNRLRAPTLARPRSDWPLGVPLYRISPYPSPSIHHVAAPCADCVEGGTQ